LLNNGILRVRSTGRANGKLRQIVATFRRSSFLDFLWYTKWETSPPALYSTSGSPNPGWVQTNCDQQRSTRSSSCSAIQFAPADKIDGPLHTEDDSLLVCNSPTFGGDANDKIEIARATNASTAFVPAGSCSASPNLLGTLVAPSKSLQLPNDNAAIKTVADYKYTGETCLDFNGATVTVRTGQSWGAGGQISCTGIGNTISLGADTVFYISAQSTGCTNTNLNAVDYASPATGGGAACGHVAVSGNYSTNVTIASANDIIVTSTLKKTDGTDGIMGLVASGYVRVYHPVNRSSGCVNVLPTPPPVTEIDAAILATTGSFMTDNYGCGAPLGNLTIKGAIAQYWRGPVGTGSAANPTSGYIKDYHYDRRLKYREPPQFLDPKTSNWNLLRESEQSPVLNS
jgi:hypothetical protein